VPLKAAVLRRFQRKAVNFRRLPTKYIGPRFADIGEPIQAIRPAETIEVRCAFAEPISAAETISRYVGKLVPQLCSILETKGLGAQCLDLVCHQSTAARSLRRPIEPRRRGMRPRGAILQAGGAFSAEAVRPFADGPAVDALRRGHGRNRPTCFGTFDHQHSTARWVLAFS
jgi:hypothetical protein